MDSSYRLDNNAGTTPPRILVIRLSALGDVLFTMPAVEALARARPDCEIHWAVEDRAASLLDLFPWVRQRIVYPRRAWSRKQKNLSGSMAAIRKLSGHLRRLRKDHYDVVLDFQGNFKSGIHAWTARGDLKAGFAKGHGKEGNHWFHSHKVTPEPHVIHRVDKALSLVRSVFPEVPEVAPRPSLSVPESSEQAFQANLNSMDQPLPRPLILLHPGTSAYGAIKRWRYDRFALLADRLAKEGLPSMITWGPGEEELARSVVAASKSGQCLLAPPTGSLGQLAALLTRGTLFVGSDSAPLHLAAALEIPVVALFGPKNHRVYAPRFAPSRVVRTYLPCSPCPRRTCPDLLCMEEISVRQVFRATLSLLDECASPTPA